MELQLKNVGMIKEANVEILGLTVVAGENDSGKSTLSKVLYGYIEAYNDYRNVLSRLKHNYNFDELFNEYLLELFNNNITENGMVKFTDIFGDEFSFLFKIENNKCYEIDIPDSNNSDYIDYLDYINYNIFFIETPLVWNLIDFFRDIAIVESQMKLKLDYPYLMKNLIFNMSIKSSNNNFANIKEQVTNLMGGEFKKDDLGKFYFDKNGQRIEVVNTATGIKSFGILQMLSQNGWLSENTILILDEPEVHLHPKWQLEMAKVIVELVKNGVKVLVNSHSPYMIEALKRYSEVEEQEDKTNFYLAEDGYIKQINNSNSETLVEIFEKLSEPFDTFEKMDEYSLGKLING